MFRLSPMKLMELCKCLDIPHWVGPTGRYFFMLEENGERFLDDECLCECHKVI